MTYMRLSTGLAVVLWAMVFICLLRILLAQPYIGLDWEDLAQTKLRTTPSILLGYQQVQIDNISTHSDWQEIPVERLVKLPHSLATFAELNAAIEYNRRVYDLLTASPVRLIINSQKTPLRVSNKSIASLPYGFWISSLTSLLALLIGVGVWSLQSKSRPTRLLLGASIVFSLGVIITNFYVYRPLVMEPFWFESGLSLQYLAMGWFPYVLLALLASYPRQIVSKSVLALCLLLPVLFYLNYLNRWFDLPFHTFFLNTLIAIILGTIAVFVQWRAVRNRSMDIAQLRWFLMSVYTIPLVMFIAFLMPSFFGYKTIIPLWLVQTAFLSLFFGLALGIARYRLFDVQRWWFKVWIWFVSGVLLIILDLGLVFLLGFDSGNALAISLVVMAWVYFPIRQWLWHRLAASPVGQPAEYLPLMIDAVLQEQPKSDMQRTWNKILQSVFEPSQITSRTEVIEEPRIVENGLYLDVPKVVGLGSVQLAGRSDGTHLFSSQDRALAGTLFKLTETMVQAKEASQQGARIERQRIIRDLHDDVGANLLTMTYKAQSEEQANLARDTLKLMRETVYALDDEEVVYLGSSIAEWSLDAEQRAALAGVSIDWQTSVDLPNPLLQPRQRINLNRIMREALSNALKHGNGKSIRIRILKKECMLLIMMENQSALTKPAQWQRRTGTNNIERRANELSGNVKWHSTSQSKTSSKVWLAISVPLF